MFFSDEMVIDQFLEISCVGHQILNVDAAYSSTDNSGDVGAIVRDDTGGFVGASCMQLSNIFDAEMAEALALREGLIVAKRLACHYLVVQSDCVSIVEALNSDLGFSSVSAHILEECRLLCQDFGGVIIQYCNRDSNSVAHELAKFGKSNPPKL